MSDQQNNALSVINNSTMHTKQLARVISWSVTLEIENEKWRSFMRSFMYFSALEKLEDGQTENVSQLFPRYFYGLLTYN